VSEVSPERHEAMAKIHKQMNNAKKYASFGAIPISAQWLRADNRYQELL
jgi:hypothetical protein